MSRRSRVKSMHGNRGIAYLCSLVNTCGSFTATAIKVQSCPKKNSDENINEMEISSSRPSRSEIFQAVSFISPRLNRARARKTSISEEKGKEKRAYESREYDEFASPRGRISRERRLTCAVAQPRKKSQPRPHARKNGSGNRKEGGGRKERKGTMKGCNTTPREIYAGAVRRE
jgi:hypothetical protein